MNIVAESDIVKTCESADLLSDFWTNSKLQQNSNVYSVNISCWSCPFDTNNVVFVIALSTFWNKNILFFANCHFLIFAIRGQFLRFFWSVNNFTDNSSFRWNCIFGLADFELVIRYSQILFCVWTICVCDFIDCLIFLVWNCIFSLADCEFVVCDCQLLFFIFIVKICDSIFVINCVGCSTNRKSVACGCNHNNLSIFHSDF